MNKTIKIISTKKIEVTRGLAYLDKTPEMAKAGTIIGTGNFINVLTLKPVSYQFVVGTNEVPEPFEFKDPVDNEVKKESILSWPTVRELIKAGIFEVFDTSQRITVESLEKEESKNSKKPKSLEEMAAETKVK